MTPQWLLTVDPGKRGCGCALWRQTAYDAVSGRGCWKLVAAEYVQGDDLFDDQGVRLRREALASACEATADTVVRWTHAHASAGRMYPSEVQLVCELPRTYGGRAAKGDANDNVVPLSVVGGMIAGALGCPTTLVWPQDWKGQIPKPEKQSEPYVVQLRVMEHLTSEEAARVRWPKNKKLQWDVADAIGIGMARTRRAFKKI